MHYVVEYDLVPVSAQDELRQSILHKSREAGLLQADLLELSPHTFGVEEAKTLKEWAHTRPLGTEKSAIVTCAKITIEAQNALLKVFEEPPRDTRIVLVLPSRAILLPTLLSRMVLRSVSDQASRSEVSLVQHEFLMMSLAERMELIAKLAKNKELTQAQSIVDSVLEKVYSQATSQERTTVLKDLLRIRSYLNDRSPSLKLLLEQVALVAPVAS